MAVKLSTTKRINNLERVKKLSLQEEHSQVLMQIEREKRSLLKDLENIQVRSASLHSLSSSTDDSPRDSDSIQDGVFCETSSSRRSTPDITPAPSRASLSRASNLPRHITTDSSPRQRKISLDSLLAQRGNALSISAGPISSPQSVRRKSTMIRKAEKLEEDIVRRNSNKGSGYMYGEAGCGRWEPVKMHKYHAAHRKPTPSCASFKSVNSG